MVWKDISVENVENKCWNTYTSMKFLKVIVIWFKCHLYFCVYLQVYVMVITRSVPCLGSMKEEV